MSKKPLVLSSRNSNYNKPQLLYANTLHVKRLSPCNSPRCQRVAICNDKTKGPKKSVHWKANVATWILMTSRVSNSGTSEVCSCDECCCSDIEFSDDSEDEFMNNDETESELAALRSASSQEELFPKITQADGETSGSDNFSCDMEVSECMSTTTASETSGTESGEMRQKFVSTSGQDDDFSKKEKKSIPLAAYKVGKKKVEKSLEMQKYGQISQSLPHNSKVENQIDSLDVDFLTFPYAMKSTEGTSKDRQTRFPEILMNNQKDTKPAVQSHSGRSKGSEEIKCFTLRNEDELSGLTSPLVHFLPRDHVAATTLLACWVGDLDYLRELSRKNRLNPSNCDCVGASCFHYAARGGHEEVLRFLFEERKKSGDELKESVPVSVVGATPLHDAAALGHLGIVQFLSKMWSNALNSKDAEGASILHVAARYGRLSVLRWLLSETEMPSADPASGGALALHYAAARGCMQCVKLLVEASLEFGSNVQMENGVTPTYLAAQEGHLDVLKYLVDEAGGQLDLRAKDGMAPVHAAAQMGCLPCLKWMVKCKGVDVNLMDGDGATPLHFAASRGHVKTVHWLLKNFATIKLDKYGKSPINDASENNHSEVLQLLLSHSAADSAAESDASDCCLTERSCSSYRGSRDISKGSHSPLSDFCSSCPSCEPFCGNRSDSCLISEPFYLHSSFPSNTKENENSKNGDHNQVADLRTNSIYDPLTELKKASDQHTQKRKTRKNKNPEPQSYPTHEPFFLHKPEEMVRCNRLQSLFAHNKRSVIRQKSKGSCSQVKEFRENGTHYVDKDLHPIPSHENSNCLRNMNSVTYSNQSSNITTGDRGVLEATRSSSSGSSCSDDCTSELSSSSDGRVHDPKTPPEEQYEEIRDLPGTKRDREKRILRGLDDLIAGVPPPDYETNDSMTKDVQGPIDDLSKCEFPRHPQLPAKGAPQAPIPKEYDDIESNGPHQIVPKALQRPPPLPNSSHKPPRIRNSSNKPPPIPNSSHKPLIRTAQPPTLPHKTIMRSSSDPQPPTPPPLPVANSRLSNQDDHLDFANYSSREINEVNENGKQQVERSQSLPVGGDTATTRSRKLSFVPPKFPSHLSGHSLIKPSEYLKSLADEGGCSSTSLPSIPEAKEEEIKPSGIPPPPPLPPGGAMSVAFTGNARMNGVSTANAMPSISVMDLKMVQLKKTEMKVSKTSSVPLKFPEKNSDDHRGDIIAELKMGIDINGIKKLKNEKAKEEIFIVEKEKEEIKKHFVVHNFVEKVPEFDVDGNPIPQWKRQMLAKKVAEKAKREAEERTLKELEERRLYNIPPWKRQLLAKKEKERLRNPMQVPKVEDIRRFKLKKNPKWRPFQAGNDADEPSCEINKV